MIPAATIALLRTQSDERLVQLARTGHEPAFEAIVERYRKPLLRACRRILPESRAEDALQQAFLAAWSALRRGDEIRDLRPWLYRVAHNTSLNALRVSGFDYDELKDSLSIVEDAPADAAERRAVIRQTLAAVANLPERQREALLRTAVEGQPQDEVARALGLSNGAVRQLVHRARVQLRAAVTAVTPMPLVLWAARGGQGAGDGVLPQRIAELVAGAAPAGAVAMALKTGAVVAGAGALVAAPVAIERSARDERPRSSTVRAAPPERAVPPAAGSAAPTGAVPAPSPQAADAAAGRALGDPRGERGSRGADGRRSSRSRRVDARRDGRDASGRGRGAEAEDGRGRGRSGRGDTSGPSGSPGRRPAEDRAAGSGSGSGGQGRGRGRRSPGAATVAGGGRGRGGRDAAGAGGGGIAMDDTSEVDDGRSGGPARAPVSRGGSGSSSGGSGSDREPRDRRDRGASDRDEDDAVDAPDAGDE